MDRKLVAIDPPGCGCTECLVGEYVPLDRASDEQVAALFRGELGDNTNRVWQIQQRLDLRGEAEGGFTASADGRTWDISGFALPVPVKRYQLTGNRAVIDRIHSGASYLEG